MPVYVYTPPHMQAELTAEKTVSADELVGIADGLYRDMVAGRSYKSAAAAFPEFAKSYPVVLRFIYEHRSYDSVVFRRWIDKFIKNPFKNEDEYLESQADYVRMLFKKKNPRAAPGESRNVFTSTLNMLKEESRQFKANYEKIKKIVDNRDAELQGRTRKELAEYIKNMPPINSLAVEKDASLRAEAFSIPPLEPEPLPISADGMM